MQTQPRKLYNGGYRAELEDDIADHSEEPGNPDGDNSNTSEDGPKTPEEGTWKKRYGDLRSHVNVLTEQVKSLTSQLTAAQKKEIQIPSSKEELTAFAAKYPDVFRHIRSIAMTELLQERENIAIETNVVKEDLDKLKIERGYAMVIKAHPDFEELKLSQEFHQWAQLQPEQIKDWLFATLDPTLCIKAIDLYKAEQGFKQKTNKRQPSADTLVNSRSAVELPGQDSKRIWKASEIATMRPKLYEKFEDEIELARMEGRIDLSA